MKKKSISAVLTVAMLCLMLPMAVFAEEPKDHTEKQVEEIAEIVENVTGTEDINTEITKTNDMYIAEGTDMNVEIPVSGEKSVVLDVKEGDNIVMNLPDDVADEEGVLTDNGTVVYNPFDENVAVSVQALQEKQDGEIFESVKTLVTIESFDAPKAYNFDFDLPEGYRLVRDYDYDDGYDDDDCGQIFIIDNHNEIICTIDPAWAKDANGKSVDSHYKIDGSTLIQVVEFNENTAFPVVADPKSHPDKWVKAYYTKSEVEKIRDKYTSDDNDKVRLGKGLAKYGVGMVIALSKKISTAVGVAWDTVWFLQDTYKSTQYATWKKIHKGFEKKKYACVAGKERWHRKGAYVATGRLKVSYTNSTE